MDDSRFDNLHRMVIDIRDGVTATSRDVSWIRDVMKEQAEPALAHCIIR